MQTFKKTLFPGAGHPSNWGCRQLRFCMTFYYKYFPLLLFKILSSNCCSSLNFKFHFKTNRVQRRIRWLCTKLVVTIKQLYFQVFEILSYITDHTSPSKICHNHFWWEKGWTCLKMKANGHIFLKFGRRFTNCLNENQKVRKCQNCSRAQNSIKLGFKDKTCHFLFVSLRWNKFAL